MIWQAANESGGRLRLRASPDAKSLLDERKAKGDANFVGSLNGLMDGWLKVPLAAARRFTPKRRALSGQIPICEQVREKTLPVVEWEREPHGRLRRGG